MRFQIFAASAEHYRDVSGDLDRQTREAVVRAQLEIEQREAQSVHEIADAIASAAEQALARRVHVFDRKIACAAAGALFGVTLVRWGCETAAANIARTESGLAIAFREGPAAAKVWLQLMQANDVRQELQCCSNEWTDPQPGRRPCYMPIWLDPPHDATPQR